MTKESVGYLCLSFSVMKDDGLPTFLASALGVELTHPDVALCTAKLEAELVRSHESLVETWDETKAALPALARHRIGLALRQNQPPSPPPSPPREMPLGLGLGMANPNRKPDPNPNPDGEEPEVAPPLEHHSIAYTKL